MRFSVLIPCALILFLAGSVRAADAGGNAKKEEPPKQAPKEAAKEVTFSGHLVNTSVEGALACLRYKPEEKGAEKKLQLFATGDVVNQIKDLMKKKNISAEVTGILAPDGTSFKVSSIKQADNKKK
jgi:hypothetical protein